MGVAPDREAVRQARRTVTALMARWAIGDDEVFRVELIVSELLTNALQHPTPAHCAEIGLSVTEAGGSVLIEVEDAGGEAEALLAACRAADGPGDDAEHGRGLLLVESLAIWGWRRLPSGHLAVWAYVSRTERRGAR
ncbi:ATP-binding protein [Streptomyces roseifaciens]|uniref:ATP-binding protein n=1 Tax=Streptomyces roseifaciens TaxID=1488406 RepID=UPI000717E9D8|nr:ATP-binding protein [Streptomyces roseifaciens]